MTLASASYPSLGWPMALSMPEKLPTSKREEVGLELRRARKRAGLTLAQASDASRLSRSTIGSIERGEHPLDSLSAKSFSQAHEAFGLPRPSFEAIIAPVYSSLAGQEKVNNGPEVIPTNVTRVPVRSMAAAGDAFYTDVAILDYEYVPDELYRIGMIVVKVMGNSMEPTILDGDHVYVDGRDLDPIDGKIFLVHIIGDGFVIKRIANIGGQRVLISDNISYGILTSDQAQIVGRAYFHQPKGGRL